jgi:hypothetical protein
MKMAEQCYPRNIIRNESRSIKLLNILGNIDITAACSMGVRDIDHSLSGASALMLMIASVSGL